MDAHDRIMDLLQYAACLSEPVATETPERLREINRCVMEVAHILNQKEWR